MDAQVITQRMRRAYDATAPSYARRTASMPPALVALGRRVLALAPAPAAVVEVGCGPGRDMAWFETQGAHVTGVDLSAGMLREARARVLGDLAQMDMRRLALADGRFDAAWCMGSLHHLPKSEAPRALTELRRVLIRDGVLALSLHEGQDEGWEPSPDDPRVDRFFARYGMREVETLLIGAGFSVVDSGLNVWRERRRLRFVAIAAATVPSPPC